MDMAAGLNSFPNSNSNNNFELQDFIGDATFDESFIDLIRGENEDPVASFDCDDLVNGCFIDNAQLVGQNPDGIMFGFDGTVAQLSDPASASLDITLPYYDGDLVFEDNENGDGEDSSATTTTTTTNGGKRPKVDRSRTLVSERRRRGRMKEKLYALRSLVPNITKVQYINKNSLNQ